MKEELLRVLNLKLDDININIDSLTELNENISQADDNLAYIKGLLERFKDDGKYNVLNLNRFSSDEFDDLLSLVSHDVSDVFKTKNCNYEGLVYLINGINNGVSLSLTIEQENAINYLIRGMEELMHNDMAIVDGLNLVKTRFAIDDIGILSDKKQTITLIVDKLNNDKYVDEIEDICEAMEFSKLDVTDMNNILVYLLKYNADIYDTHKTYDYEEAKEDKKEDVISEEVLHEEVNPVVNEEQNEKDVDDKEEIEFHLPEFNKIEEENVVATPTDYDVPIIPEIDNSFDEISVDVPNTVDLEVESENENIVENNLNDSNEENNVLDDHNIDEDFNDIIPQDDYEEYRNPEQMISMPSIENEKTSTREVQRLFQEYDINIDDSELNQYLDGNIEEYEKVIKVLKNNGLLSNIVNNKGLFREIIVNSKENEVINVLDIVKNDLSVDSEDYGTTLKIVVDTIPSIFVSADGNYDNFVQNIKLFKELGINLVNLFDFSKEVLIANHDTVLKNYEIVKEYNISIDYKNAKYFLLLNDIASRIDYYVESVYKDELKNEMFDGYNFIKEYPSKLNVVTDETIKRLRYSSETGKKVFGSKPNSLAGEITNLKVNVLDIPGEYMDNFFDNKFDDITDDEIRQYAKLCNNSSNVGDYLNELSGIEKYHNNLRYVFEKINVSFNKVVRCYNTLRSYGIDKKKALEFAVCYNLVITKEEYGNLKKVLTEGVGE